MHGMCVYIEGVYLNRGANYGNVEVVIDVCVCVCVCECVCLLMTFHGFRKPVKSSPVTSVKTRSTVTSTFTV